ncbi:hypothetical protein DH2020_011319 [Rehmannia glutinosa]|uniref:Sodium/calcium exchanger membrane region domain-containing protein n=1 Tax=Rehmannia glutinosa TaxID=99300 RepID=A0ABR0XD61_REHGL
MTCSIDGIISGKSTPELEDVHLVNLNQLVERYLLWRYLHRDLSLVRDQKTLVVNAACFLYWTDSWGLLNATFGNATELIISMHALKSGMIRVVQQSLLGSILSNMLLPSATMNSGLLLMAVMGLLFPAVLHFTHTELHFGKSELALSRFSSCIMLEESQTDGCSDDNEEPDMSKWESIMWLFILTSLISVLSEYLVNAIEKYFIDIHSVPWGDVAMNIPIAFISVILLPIVGNAAEHAGAIMFAVKDKLDISLAVAIGSSTQIAMFGIPFTVVVGWVMGRPMDLNFQLFETATLIMTVLVVAFMLQEGTSNYFKGLMLLLCYLIVAQVSLYI